MPGEGIDKSRGGRPSERGEAKRAPINMRTTPTIRAALEDAAARGGRSLAQEIEQRLERSIEEDARNGGPHTAAFLRLAGAAIQTIELQSGARWTDDWPTFAKARAALTRLLDWYNPGADIQRQAKLQRIAEDARMNLQEVEAELRGFYLAKGVDSTLGARLIGKQTPGEARGSWSEAEREAERGLLARENEARDAFNIADAAAREEFDRLIAMTEACEQEAHNVADALTIAEFSPRSRRGA